MSQSPVIVGLIGSGIQASRTPAMHLAAAQALGLDYQYDLIDTDQRPTETSLSALLSDAEAKGYCGLNITYPFKTEVLAHLDSLSEDARTMGAVNTVRFEDGRRIGHNTDYSGFAESMRHSLPDADLREVLLLGAGGAGGAVAHALKSMGTGSLLIHDVNPDQAATLANQTGGVVVRDLKRAASVAAGIVNATPMGMAKLPGTAIPTALLRPNLWIMDIVYFPLETELLRAARQIGCRTANGGAMALYQAVHAFEIFTGLKPDPAIMRARFDAFDR
ncbi:shikimate dehydrogenase [Pacificoceanicola onchidii]|uniref:shikimate dehydrogenase n=1 Tax=Pacificoceanicola onchidii TaxID=2562685 RepID=UPI0010A6B399|nr:shikimate dehydrogenase [Pacificoceanicola onchidii]